MELRIVILYSLLLVSARESRAASVDGSTGNEWPESSVVRANEGIDPKGAEFHSVITPATLERENGANSATVLSSSLSSEIHRTVSAVAATTGRRGRRWSRTKRAAEILGTSVSNHQAVVSSSSVLPTTETTSSTTTTTQWPVSALDSTSQATSQVSIETSSEPVTTTTVLSTTPTTTTTTAASTTMTPVTHLLSSIQPPPSQPVFHDESDSESEQNNTTVSEPPTTTAATTTTSITTTTTQHVIGNEEYLDDAAGSTSSTTDATSDDDETTVIADKSAPTIATVVAAVADSEHSNISTGMDDTVDPVTTTSSETSRLAVSAVVAVGRALSQEESVPWPEAKSTKVIGTIIEDIHGPFSDGVSSVSTSSPDVLTSSGIAAIVMCSFLVLLTTAGASGYWWYRRRYLLNRPETLSERYAPSETGLGAGDDIFRVGYVHSPELPRDSSEEMYSLDNDSFLTSLEAMTIPTYWTETIKHTKL